jgi:hypothetical protein
VSPYYASQQRINAAHATDKPKAQAHRRKAHK